MFIRFFFELKNAGIPVSLREHLTLLEAMSRNLACYEVNKFYYLSRSTLVKDERYLDRFDRVFSQCFQGLEGGSEDMETALPEEWLAKLTELHLTEEEKAEIERMGGFEKLMETLKKRLEQQKGRHQGGSKWIGTAGTSPYGAYGYNPEGVRIGQEKSRHRRAIKVWDRREYRNLDDTIEIGTRNIKVALRRLRRLTRDGAAIELDLPNTIKSTAHNGGYLDIQMVPERRNAVKVLLFLDAGGSMDDHVKVCEELFSAARSEFKNLEFFYFHNCLYEGVWRDNRRRHSETLSTLELLRSYPSDYKVIIVGDATMSPYEITYPGGSVEHWNEESGGVWMQRLLSTYPSAVWLNPQGQRTWDYYDSIRIMREIMGNRMYPLTIEGLDEAMRAIS